MTTHEFALSDLAARLFGSDASLSTSLRDILTVALQELIEAELTAPWARGGEHPQQRTERGSCSSAAASRSRVSPIAGGLISC